MFVLVPTSECNVLKTISQVASLVLWGDGTKMDVRHVIFVLGKGVWAISQHYSGREGGKWLTPTWIYIATFLSTGKHKSDLHVISYLAYSSQIWLYSISGKLQYAFLRVNCSHPKKPNVYTHTSFLLLKVSCLQTPMTDKEVKYKLVTTGTRH